MTSKPLDEKRQVVPRWRSTQRSIGSAEFKENTAERSPEFTYDDFPAAFSKWQKQPSIETAAAALAAASAVKKFEQAYGPAYFILKHRDETFPSLVRMAEFIVGYAPVEQNPADRLTEDLSEARTRQRIKILKRQIERYDRDSLTRLDLALAYLNSGQKHAAEKQMQIALNIAPDHRVVLRRAVRLYVHYSEFDIALDVLRRSERLYSDPWLMSAEIAVSQISKKQTRVMRQAQALLNDRTFDPKQTSELSAAVGTSLMLSGGSRRARQYLREGLVDPTDNSIAQINWVNKEFGTTVELNKSHLEQRFSFEARAQKAYWDGEWEICLAEAGRWLNDEPFSSRPALLGSFVSSSILCDFEKGLAFSKQGLLANPGDRRLRNNLAYALANLGRIEEAEENLDMIASGGEAENRCAVTATRGLIEILKGNTEYGRKLYEVAFTECPEIPEVKISLCLHAAVNQGKYIPEHADDVAKFLKEAEILTKDKKLKREDITALSKLAIEQFQKLQDYNRKPYQS